MKDYIWSNKNMIQIRSRFLRIAYICNYLSAIIGLILTILYFVNNEIVNNLNYINIKKIAIGLQGLFLVGYCCNKLFIQCNFKTPKTYASN